MINKKSFDPNKRYKRKTRAYDINKTEVQDFFVYLVVINLVYWLYFYFIRVVKVAMGLIISLVINRVVLASSKIIIDFFKLFL